MEKNAMATDEEERINNLLTSKIDELTGGEMKKVGVQKMENELTIRKLDREYAETKRNLLCSKKMLDEARKNISTQTETKNQLLQANKAMIEKFNELKKYQNEITLINISKGEKSLQDCLERNDECARILNMILDKDNYFDFLNKNLLDKENQLNEDIQRQIEQNKQSVKNKEETLLVMTKKFETQKIQIDGEKTDDRVKLAVEEKNKRIIQLQADAEASSKQLKQEMNDLQQKKLNKVQTRNNLKNDIKTTENQLSDLQSELSEVEKQLMAQSEDLENVKMKIKDISSDIQRKRDANSQSNEFLENNLTNLQSELNLLDSELQNEQTAFSEIENKMQDEMKRLFSELEERKKLQNILENRQHELSKLKENRKEQQQLSSQNVELDNKLTKLTEEYKKQLSIGSAHTNKQIELNIKIKDLRDKRDNAKRQLENLNKIQYSRSSATNAMLSQQINSQKKSYGFSRNDRELEKNISSSQIPKKTSSHSENVKSVAFNLDSSDESEDDSKIDEKAPKKHPGSSATPIYKKQDYSCGFDDKNNENSANEGLSQSEILFDQLMASQKPAESSMNRKDEDVFKIPSTYTPVKKRSSTQSKKY